VVDHFLAAKLVTPEQVANWRTKHVASCNSCGKQAVPKAPATVSEAIATYAALEPDIAEHVTPLSVLAGKCKTVLDLGSRLSSSLALALGAKGTSIHFGDVKKEDIRLLRSLKASAWHSSEISGEIVGSDIDLVFIDMDPHSEEQVYEQLTTFGKRSQHYIALHDTTLEGVRNGVLRFLRENQEWTVINNYENNNGLFVLSRSAEDKKAVPALHKQVVKFARSLAAFTLSGWKLALPQVYEDRLKTCDLCEHRNDNKCGMCGCPIDKKASFASENCPDKRW